MPEQIAIWIPNDLNPASQTSVIANYMLSNNRKVIPIDVNTEYHNNFTEYYDKHIRQNEQFNNTFCSKYGTGINVEYLIANANKKTYATLLSLEVDPMILRNSKFLRCLFLNGLLLQTQSKYRPFAAIKNDLAKVLAQNY